MLPECVVVAVAVCACHVFCMSVRPNNLPGDKKDYDGEDDEDYDNDEGHIEDDDVNES